MANKDELLEAKRRLYWLLLESTKDLTEDEIPDSELDMMVALAKDKQIQSLFQKNKS